eukprot:GHRR01017080.1.p1 GENE.GHRR01017080.1~~GHRR01017080.1.p1  ORF type:complete len:148 (+),score=14.04 GHRR01017080.1:898-1341(+)
MPKSRQNARSRYPAWARGLCTRVRHLKGRACWPDIISWYCHEAAQPIYDPNILYFTLLAGSFSPCFAFKHAFLVNLPVCCAGCQALPWHPLSCLLNSTTSTCTSITDQLPLVGATALHRHLFVDPYVCCRLPSALISTNRAFGTTAL